MHLYKCVVKYGHNGSGKYLERALYIKARNIIEAMSLAKTHRGVKKGNLQRTGASILYIVPQW